MKAVRRLQTALLLLTAMVLLLAVSVSAASAPAQSSALTEDSSYTSGTGLTVYPDGTSELPQPLYSAAEDSEDEIHLPDPAQSRPVILIVSIAVLVIVVSVSVFIEKKYRKGP